MTKRGKYAVGEKATLITIFVKLQIVLARASSFFPGNSDLRGFFQQHVDHHHATAGEETAASSQC